MKNNQMGRSMVEMLGVLAIIGVLSVAGIYGYTVAMRKHHANEILQTISMLAVMAQTANSGEGGCVELSSTALNKKPGGINVEMVANSTGSIENSVTVRINDSDRDKLCNIINSSPYVNTCGGAEIEPCSE